MTSSTAGLGPLDSGGGLFVLVVDKVELERSMTGSGVVCTMWIWFEGRASEPEDDGGLVCIGPLRYGAYGGVMGNVGEWPLGRGWTGLCDGLYGSGVWSWRAGCVGSGDG